MDNQQPSYEGQYYEKYDTSIYERRGSVMSMNEHYQPQNDLQYGQNDLQFAAQDMQYQQQEMQYPAHNIEYPAHPMEYPPPAPYFDEQPELTVKKPKSSSASKLYALRIASTPGIYHNWNVAKALIEGCPGAKYKGFYTLEECMAFIWEQFPSSTFTKNDDGDYIMDDPEPVFQVIEGARVKKEKNSGFVVKDDLSSFEASDSANYSRLLTAYQSHPNMSISLNPSQTLALDAVMEGKNVLVSGIRSSGKDVLLSHITCKLASARKTFHVMSASVINSLNSQLNFALGWTGMGKALGTKKQILMKVRKNTQARKAWVDANVLIITDCSMLSAFLLDIMDFLAKEIRKDGRAFGGIQVVLMGDFYDLGPAPVQAVCCPSCGQNHRVNNTGYNAGQAGSLITCTNETCGSIFLNNWLLYPFEASCWDEAAFNHFNLTSTFEPDATLAQLFSDVATTEGISERAAAILDQRRVGNVGEYSTIICPNIEEATKLNDEKLQELPGDSVKYEAIDTVLNNFDFSSRAQQKDGPTDEITWLKKDAHVLLLENNTSNTFAAVVTGFVTLTPEIKAEVISRIPAGMKPIESAVKQWLAKNTALPQVRIISTGELRTIACKIWAVRLNRRNVAWRVQLPLRLGYAAYIHKVHGLRLENLLISSNMEWLPGQMYSAVYLSKSFASLNSSNCSTESFASDTRVRDFFASKGDGSVCRAVKSNNIPDGFLATPSSSKRHSVVSLGGSSKKRRPSKPVLAPIASPNPLGDDPLAKLRPTMGDPLLLRYHQQLQQRRHSYQPLTSFQEQQFAWMASQNQFPPSNMGLTHGRGLEIENVLGHTNLQPLHSLAIPEFSGENDISHESVEQKTPNSGYVYSQIGLSQPPAFITPPDMGMVGNMDSIQSADVLNSTNVQNGNGEWQQSWTQS